MGYSIIFSSIIILSSFISSSVQTSETKLIHYLTERSSNLVRPVFNISQSTLVKFGFELVHLVSISETTQTLTAKFWVRMYWKNDYLKWNPAEWGGVKNTRFTYNGAWTPDIFLMEDVGKSLSNGPASYKTLVTSRYNGDQQWFIPVLWTTSCDFDIGTFPYDRQRCTFRFLSWTHDQTELDLTPDTAPILTESYLDSTEWKLVNITQRKNVKKYACCPNAYVDLEYTIRMDRRPMHYIVNAVIPCLIQMAIILTTFFLPPESGERISVVITVLLVFAVYLEVISSSLPKTSDTISPMSLFYIASMAASSCSLLATCFVLIAHFKGAEKGIYEMPRWMSRIFIDIIGSYVFIKRNRYIYEPPKVAEKHDDEVFSSLLGGTFPGQEDKATIIGDEWRTLAKVLDRLFFLFFLAVYVILTTAIFLPIIIKHSKHDH